MAYVGFLLLMIVNLEYLEHNRSQAMKTIEVKFRHRGKGFEGIVAIPDDLTEAVTTLGEEYVYQCFSEGYLEAQRRQMRGRKKRFLKVELSQLTDDQLQQLKGLGLIR